LTIVNGYELVLLGINYVNNNTIIECEIVSHLYSNPQYFRLNPDLPLGERRWPFTSSYYALRLVVMSN